MSKKLAKPVSPLIYQVAATFAGVYYEAGRSTGLGSKHKTPEAFAKANLEKFIPYAIKHLLQLLKPTSNVTEHMRQEIYAAITDPMNDPDLMQGTKKGTLPDIDAAVLSELAFGKNQLKFNDIRPNKPDLKSSTSLTLPTLAKVSNG